MLVPAGAHPQQSITTRASPVSGQKELSTFSLGRCELTLSWTSVTCQLRAGCRAWRLTRKARLGLAWRSSG